MEPNELQRILDNHKKWLDSEPDGERANLQGAYLRDANLRGADLRDANLRDANLQEANLRWANLQRANLRDANLDFACWPLWCGSKNVRVDRNLAAQLAAHFCALDCDDPGYLAARAAVLEFAKTSHRARDMGLLNEEA